MTPALARLHRTVISLTVLAAVSACASRWRLPADSPPATAGSVSDPALSQAAAAAEGLLLNRLGEMPGLAVAVGDGRSILWSRGLGVADLAAREPATPQTRFRVYSVAKPLTATLAVRLAQQGRLRLDAPIADHLPSLPAPLRRLTLARLLSHTAGVRHYQRGEWTRVSRLHCFSTLEALAPFRDDPPVAEPGSSYHYSSFGYVLASAVLEAAGGRPFHDLLQQEILHPAGMTGTARDTPPYDDPLVAGFYVPARFGRVGESQPWDNSCKWGAGGLLSTVEDLVRFGNALLGDRLLDAAGRHLLFTRQALSSGEAIDYGLGWGLENSDEGGTSLAWASGGAFGGRSYLMVDLERRLVIALAGNLEGESFAPEARRIHAAFADATSRSRAGELDEPE